MKRLILLAMLGLAFSVAPPAKAQVNVSINIGSQPQWGPRGYDYVDYYYMPEIESYYSVPTRQFIYYSGNRWIHSRSLPSRYRSYDLYSGRKYVINAPHPYRNHNVYKVKYNKRYSNRGPIHYSNDRHYKNKNQGRGHYEKDRGRGKKRDNDRYEGRRERRDPGIERIIRPRG
ncbi:hypothetical protein [Pedobacter frigoris]|uniref:DUF3300 domain-containing protein n=1 Tax=Pedobacter frigoris TaxID=2571272 RepID=A0A4U1CFM9_9SPHI|nr:hypothetical protein [Pedobacter frigoris]TKC05972.1 hypothetical protein FA047_11575 [Pedobacter frigoris]